MTILASSAASAATSDFAAFDRAARHGDRLTVVFFGASLTWGANASDQANTSYRARIAERLEAEYPKAHFRFYDAAIGGTGSQLGVFRLDRDVLRRKPDLVFLDFSANDDIYSDAPETLASYESLVRRLVAEAGVPVIQMIFPFQWNVTQGNTDGMKRRDAHIAIAGAYHTAVGDAIVLLQERIKSGAVTPAQIWPADGVHPGDLGYSLFAEAGWLAYQDAVKRKLCCRAPDKMLYADTYMHQARVRVSTLYATNALPRGWHPGTPSLTAAWHDGLMSRWLDDIVFASNREKTKGADGKDANTPITPERLKARFTGSMVMLFGEGTTKSGQYRVRIDGKVCTYVPWGKKESADLFDASTKRFGGTIQHVQVIATGLDTGAEHTIEIEPLLAADEEQELRLESICVAGGDARVRAF